MFEVRYTAQNSVELFGRLDAAQADHARKSFEQIQSTTTINCKGLEYISSAGLGVLLGVQKRLKDVGGELILSNLNPQIRNVFSYSGFDKIFKIEAENSPR